MIVNGSAVTSYLSNEKQTLKRKPAHPGLVGEQGEKQAILPEWFAWAFPLNTQVQERSRL
jgi:hypothetical protein